MITTRREEEGGGHERWKGVATTDEMWLCGLVNRCHMWNFKLQVLVLPTNRIPPVSLPPSASLPPFPSMDLGRPPKRRFSTNPTMYASDTFSNRGMLHRDQTPNTYNAPKGPHHRPPFVLVGFSTPPASICLETPSLEESRGSETVRQRLTKERTQTTP